MYNDDEYPSNITVNINANRNRDIVHLFTKPVERWYVTDSRGRFDKEPGEGVASSRKEFIGAYWCPYLGVIRLGLMRYQRLDTLGPAITDDVPRLKGQYEDEAEGSKHYQAITVAMKAIEEAEREITGFLPGARTEDDAWEAWSVKSDEEKKVADERYNEVPF